MHVARRRWKSRDHSAAEPCGPLRRPADLQYLYVVHRPQPHSFQQLPRGDVGNAAETTDADRFSLEVFRDLMLSSTTNS